MMTRRQLGTALLGSAAGGLGWQAARTGAFEACQGIAYEPWRTWSNQPGLRRAVAAATLAASPHNTQPWLFRIAERRIDVLSDHRRTIGTIDPLLREHHIGMGCALENLLIAAQDSGSTIKDLSFDQNPVSERIVSIEFASSKPTESALCRAIPFRHTNRGPYQTGRDINARLLNEIEDLNADRETIQVVMWTERSGRARIRDLIIAASEEIVADREQSRDSNEWYRATRSAIALHRDGLTLDAQGLSPGLRFIAKLMPEPSPSLADHVFLKNTKGVHCATAAAFGTIAVRAPLDKEARVRVGRLWQRMHLWATANGIAMQPMNQVHEREDREADGHRGGKFGKELAALLNEPGWHGIFSFRMGYASRPALPSPRRDLTQVVL